MFFKVLVRYTTSCCVLSNHACNVYIFPLCDGAWNLYIDFIFIIYLFLASTPPRSSTPSGNMAGKLLIAILFIYYYYYYFLF